MKIIPLLVSILFIHVNLITSNTIVTKTDKRQVGTYDAISVSGSYRVTLVEGSEGEITLHGSEDDLDLTEILIKNNVLIIRSEKTSWYKKWNVGKVEVTVPVEKISKLTLSGSGRIHNDFNLKAARFKSVVSGSGNIKINLSTDLFDGIISGSGSIDIQGDTNVSNVKITGSGNFDGERLASGNTEVVITGSGGAQVHAENAIDVLITGSGNVKCYGNPTKQNSRVTGSGKISIIR